jgi:hypothetical protein
MSLRGTSLLFAGAHAAAAFKPQADVERTLHRQVLLTPWTSPTDCTAGANARHSARIAFGFDYRLWHIYAAHAASVAARVAVAGLPIEEADLRHAAPIRLSEVRFQR